MFVQIVLRCSVFFVSAGPVPQMPTTQSYATAECGVIAVRLLQSGETVKEFTLRLLVLALLLRPGSLPSQPQATTTQGNSKCPNDFVYTL